VWRDGGETRSGCGGDRRQMPPLGGGITATKWRMPPATGGKAVYLPPPRAFRRH